jgi:hypothetical protein
MNSEVRGEVNIPPLLVHSTTKTAESFRLSKNLTLWLKSAFIHHTGGHLLDEEIDKISKLLKFSACRACRVKHMTCRFKPDRGSSVVRPRSLREMQRVT